MEGDIQKCCRICLDVESEHVSILGDPTIHLHLKSCLGIRVDSSDDLPKVICGPCANQLKEFYNFQLTARCSQDFLESSVQEKSRKSTETKTPIQPLPDSEYNSDSLLEFLNNTANIEEYLNNLGKEDIPSIVNLLDRNEKSISAAKLKMPTPKKKEAVAIIKKADMKMEIDVLDSDIDVVKEILMKGTEPKIKANTNQNMKVQIKTLDKNNPICFACKVQFDNIHKLSQHLSTCDLASRTCIHCNMLFDSKQKMQQHFVTHNNAFPLMCSCGMQFPNREKLTQHHKSCHVDYGAAMGCSYRCKECGQIFRERFQLYHHAREHVFKSEERICDICGHRFIGSEALVKHRKEEHETADNLLYRCKVCSFTSADRKETYLHVKNHTSKQGVQEPSRHLCESCGKSFTTPSSLLRHSLQHEKLKEHTCAICSKRFADEKARNEHNMIEHSHVIMCERCGQTLNSYTIPMHRCL